MERFKNILLVTGNGEGQENAFERAVNLALNNQGQLTILDITGEIPARKKNLLGKLFSKELDEVLVRDREQYLAGLVASVQHKLRIDIKTATGEPSQQIIQAVLQDKYDLVIKPSHQYKSLKSLFFGSTDMRLLRKCPCPVCIVNQGERQKFRRILAAVDIEPSSDDQAMDAFNQELMEIATGLAAYEACDLYFIHAWLVFGEEMLESSHLDNQRGKIEEWLKVQRQELHDRQEEFKEKLDRLLKQKGLNALNPEILMVEGIADEVIPRVALEKEVDLIIMGTVGRRGLSGFFMGNTAENILTQINCSVLAIKPAWFASPESNN